MCNGMDELKVTVDAWLRDHLLLDGANYTLGLQ